MTWKQAQTGQAGSASAASCGCDRARPSSRRDAAGARWRCTWRGTTACASRAFNVSGEQLRVCARARRARGARRTASSSSTTITGTCAGSSTRSCRSACSSTWAAVVLRRWRRHAPDRRSATAGAVSCTSSAATCPAPLNAVDAPAHLPWRLPTDACRSDDRDVLAPAGMSVVDVENLRLHYARTLAHWSERFAGARGTSRAQSGEEFCRAWELYLAGSEAAFGPGGCSCSRWSSRRVSRRRPSGRARPLYSGRGARA